MKVLTREQLAKAILRHSSVGLAPEAKLIADVIVQAAEDCVDSRLPEESYSFAIDGRIDKFAEAIGVPVAYVKSVFWAYVLHRLEVQIVVLQKTVKDIDSGATIEDLKKKNLQLRKDLVKAKGNARTCTAAA